MADIRIFLNGRRLTGFDNVSLERSKENLTGLVHVNCLMNNIPDQPLLQDVTTGSALLVYIGTHLAFRGKVDRRSDDCDLSRYEVDLSARGETKALIDSSVQETQTTILNKSNKQIVEQLIAPWNIKLDWIAEEVNLDRFRIRDGAPVHLELRRIAESFGLFFYETRDGRLRFNDVQPGSTGGQALILGENILGFSAEKSADAERSDVTVKSQSKGRGKWGEIAVEEQQSKVSNQSVAVFSPVTVQSYDDGDERRRQKRAQYEMNRRSAAGQRIDVDVLHIQQPSGDAWDVGGQHYLEIPPLGVQGIFEIVGLRYTITDGQLQTRLTFSPVPVQVVSGNSGVLIDLPDFAENLFLRPGLALGELATEWLQPQLETVSTAIETVASDLFSSLEALLDEPPLVLPEEDE